MKSRIEKSIAAIAQHAGATFVGDPEKIIAGVAPFDRSGPRDVTLAGEPRYLKNLGQTGAGAAIVPESFQDCEKYAAKGLCMIRAKNPRAAWAKIIQLFYPTSHPDWGVSPAANTGRDFRCGKNPSIGPFCVIGDDVTIGDRAVVYPFVYIGDGALLGDDVVIYSNVSIGWGTRIGNRCIVHPGTVIGSDGFGFAPDGERWEKIPQKGIVQIDDDVEIGALNSIDRATFGKTRIGSGVKTDNQVHLAHNVTVGQNSLMVAQVGVAGSATIGKNVILAGRAGVAQHVTIGDGAIMGPTSATSKDIAPKAVVSGAPAIDHRKWLRVQAVVPELPDLKKRIAELEKRLEQLTGAKETE
jgi:UDP-3-O-[3-hydroxymyristoyl] glucosamine N-acyltransferase